MVEWFSTARIRGKTLSTSCGQDEGWVVEREDKPRPWNSTFGDWESRSLGVRVEVALRAGRGSQRGGEPKASLLGKRAPRRPSGEARLPEGARGTDPESLNPERLDWLNRIAMRV